MKAAARNAVVVSDIQAGVSYADLARRYGLSRQRIHQIWRRDGGGGSNKAFREIPPHHVRCACGDLRIRGDMADHGTTPRHRTYQRARFLRRFWCQVAVRETGCWEWLGVSHSQTGYGVVTSLRGCPVPVRRGGDLAHRVAYQLAVGPIADGLTIDHLCRNRICANPAHLEAVTQRENVLRSPIALAAINARKTHCPQGHSYSAENTGYRRDGHGRWCRACNREHQRVYVRSRRTAVA